MGARMRSGGADALNPRRPTLPRPTVRSGRRLRTVRRLLAAVLVVLAGVSASWPDPPPEGTQVVVVSTDLSPGARLGASDLHLVPALPVPDGALTDPAGAVGRVLTGAVRRGEILTDARLVPLTGPDPGRGRTALTVRPADPAAVDPLGPGMHIAVLTLAADGSVLMLTEDAVVLDVPPATATGPPARPVLLAVPTADANRVSAATLSGEVVFQFT